MTLEEFNKKWGKVNDPWELDYETLTEFKTDCFDMYETTGFIEKFDSPYDDIGGLDGHEHNGMKFEVIRRATIKDGFEMEVMPLWFIRFENGDEAFCYPEEICKAEHPE